MATVVGSVSEILNEGNSVPVSLSDLDDLKLKLSNLMNHKYITQAERAYYEAINFYSWNNRASSIYNFLIL